jgi:hypothetical protein
LGAPLILAVAMALVTALATDVEMAFWINFSIVAIWVAMKGFCSDISAVLEDSVYGPTIGLVSLVDAVIMAGLAGSGLPISSLNSSKAC